MLWTWNGWGIQRPGLPNCSLRQSTGGNDVLVFLEAMRSGVVLALHTVEEEDVEPEEEAGGSAQVLE